MDLDLPVIPDPCCVLLLAMLFRLDSRELLFQSLTSGVSLAAVGELQIRYVVFDPI